MSVRVALGEELLGDVDGALGLELQGLVEAASRELGRPVAIDDRHFRLLAHTEHPSDVDHVRMLSVLKQQLPDDVIAWLDVHGVRNAEQPVVVDANPALRMQRRVCTPIRCHGHLLGYLWLLDPDASITPADLERAASIADSVGVVLYRDLILQDLDRSRERELLRDILSADARVREEAVWQLLEYELFVVDAPVCVLVATLPAVADDHSAEATTLAIDAALGRMRRRIAPRHALHLVRPDHALLLVSMQDPGIRDDGLRHLGERFHEELAPAAAGHAEERRTVAIGGVVPELAAAEASYGQALRAARVAASVRSFGDVIHWEDLGVYRVLAELPLGGLGQETFHPGLRRMIDDPGSHFLVRTLEVYLDQAGDAPATAAALGLHRTSLYNRLRRIEREASTDLSDGGERLALHLCLKLGRLAGLEWNCGDDAAEPTVVADEVAHVLPMQDRRSTPGA